MTASSPPIDYIVHSGVAVRRTTTITPMDSWSFWLTPIPQCSSIQLWAEHMCVYRGELFGRNKIHNDRCSMNPMDLYIVYLSSQVAVQQCKHAFAMTGQLCSAPIGWGQRRPHSFTSHKWSRRGDGLLDFSPLKKCVLVNYYWTGCRGPCCPCSLWPCGPCPWDSMRPLLLAWNVSARIALIPHALGCRF